MKLNQVILPRILGFSIFSYIFFVASSLPIFANEILLSQKNDPNQTSSSLEKSIIRDINRARTNPLGYADLLESSLLIKSNLDEQRRSQVLEVINFLRNLNPLPAINSTSNLTEIATELVTKNDANVSDYLVINFALKQDKPVAEIMLDLLINNSNRTTIFTPTLNDTGIACNSSQQKCVIAYLERNQVSSNNTHTPETPEIPEIPETPEITNQTPEITNQTPEIPEITNQTPEITNQTPEIPEITNQTPEITNQTPEISEITNQTPEITNQTPEIPETPETPEITASTTNNNNNQQQETTNATNSTNPENPEIAATQKYDLFERGVLQNGDAVIPSDNSLYDAYNWKGKKGDTLVITLESQEFDPYLAVQDPQGKIIAENDDIKEGDSNSFLKVILPADGVYRLIVNSYDPKGRGNYTITVIKNPSN